jgi:hypothetical protein
MKPVTVGINRNQFRISFTMMQLRSAAADASKMPLELSAPSCKELAKVNVRHR